MQYKSEIEQKIETSSGMINSKRSLLQFGVNYKRLLFGELHAAITGDESQEIEAQKDLAREMKVQTFDGNKAVDEFKAGFHEMAAILQPDYKISVYDLPIIQFYSAIKRKIKK